MSHSRVPRVWTLGRCAPRNTRTLAGRYCRRFRIVEEKDEVQYRWRKNVLDAWSIAWWLRNDGAIGLEIITRIAWRILRKFRYSRNSGVDLNISSWCVDIFCQERHQMICTARLTWQRFYILPEAASKDVTRRSFDGRWPMNPVCWYLQSNFH